MAERQSTVLVDGLRFPEGPRWHDGRLWCSDQHDRRVLAIGVDGAVETIVEVPERPVGAGLAARRAHCSSSRCRTAGSSGSTRTGSPRSPTSPSSRPWHCNDMVVDAVGRAYIGNFGFDLDGRADAGAAPSIVRVDPDGSMRVAADDIRFPNGTVITPDGATLDRGGELRRLPHRVRRRRGRRPLEPAPVGEARRRGAGRHLPRRRGRDLVRVPADRPRAARARGR